MAAAYVALAAITFAVCLVAFFLGVPGWVCAVAYVGVLAIYLYFVWLASPEDE